MDKTEIMTLSIVAIAALLVVRYFCKRKGGGCCSKDCFKPKDPSSKK